MGGVQRKGEGAAGGDVLGIVGLGEKGHAVDVRRACAKLTEGLDLRLVRERATLGLIASAKRLFARKTGWRRWKTLGESRANKPMSSTSWLRL